MAASLMAVLHMAILHQHADLIATAAMHKSICCTGWQDVHSARPAGNVTPWPGAWRFGTHQQAHWQTPEDDRALWCMQLYAWLIACILH